MTVRLDPAMWRAVKLAALDGETTMQAFIAEAIAEKLAGGR